MILLPCFDLNITAIIHQLGREKKELVDHLQQSEKGSIKLHRQGRANKLLEDNISLGYLKCDSERINIDPLFRGWNFISH